MIQIAPLLLALVFLPDPPVDFPRPDWERAAPIEVGMDEALLKKVRAYALSGGGSGMVIRSGKVVSEWGDLDQRYDLKSTTKSFGATALGVAIKEGIINLDDPVVDHHPNVGIPPESNRDRGWRDAVTVLHLATQTAGFDKSGGFEPILFEPGTAWHYSDGGPNWLAEVLTLRTGRDLSDWMAEKVFRPIGIGPEDLSWRDHAYRPAKLKGIPSREFGSGIHANVDAMARLGYLYLRGGHWKGQQILRPSFIDTARMPLEGLQNLPTFENAEHNGAAQHYGLLWWNNADGALPDVPRDAYWSWGLYDSLIVVIPSLDIVAARAGKSWNREAGWGHYRVLEPFLQPLTAAVTTAAVPKSAPYPPSDLIVGMDWEPAYNIVRRAQGSDNWPLTADADGTLFTAFGDGYGFRPFLPEKLSLGLARVTGPPDNPTGRNIRSRSLERKGDGPNGEKASGILMIDDTLYLLVRNAENARLGWSENRGRSWTWADWRFEASFGCPTFVNFGRNYEGALDDFVYVVSPDSDSAYRAADRLVLGRVPRDQIRQRNSYEFLSGLDPNSGPQWSSDIRERTGIFENHALVYRSTLAYHKPLQRFLLCQTLGDGDTRKEGGFGIYEAPELWGPWRTVFFTDSWEVGPGETQSLPPEWATSDGLTVHLVFSGDDAFSIRRARLWLRESKDLITEP